MTTPTWVTAENIRFDGSTQNVAILKVDGSLRTVVMWDNIPVSDQVILEALVDDYGGDAPLASPSAGYQTIVFSSAKVGGSATGLANNATLYTISVNIDGTVVSATISGDSAQTFTDLIVELDAVLTGTTSAVVGGNLVITSDTTGTGSLVSVVSGTLFRSLSGFSRVNEPKEGVNDLVEALHYNKAPNGEFLINTIATKIVSDKPTVHPNTPHSPAYLYFGGSPETWRYLDDDTAFVVCTGGPSEDEESPNFVFGGDSYTPDTDFEFN